MAVLGLTVAGLALALAFFAFVLAFAAYDRVRSMAPLPSTPLAVPSAVADRLAAEFSQPVEDNDIHLVLAPNYAACGKVIDMGAGVTDLQRELVTCPACNEWLEANRTGAPRG